MAYCEIPQEEGRTKGTHGPSGLKHHSLGKANTIADSLKNQFAPRDLHGGNHERRVEARVQALSKL
jgi:hypothetical protein